VIETPSQRFNREANTEGRQRARQLAKYATDSRQQRRRREFAAEFYSVTQRFGGEPRKARRGIAWARISRRANPTAKAA
jgi:hypothetical protein